MERESDVPFLRIGELSRRVGVSEHLLRAWEMRYGLIDPARSEGGFRLYSRLDEFRVRRMLAYLSQGLAAAQAAQAAKVESENGPNSPEKIDLNRAYSLLRKSLDELDEPAAQAVLDRLFADFSVETVFRDVLLPYLTEMGTRWVAKTLTVGQEHFASNILRGRLAELARGWGNGDGPSALLACPPGEVHEFALLISGIMLHRNGWTVRYLGTNTPLSDITDLTSQTRPTLVLMSATMPAHFTSIIPELRHLATSTTLVLSGQGATRAIANQCGAKLVEGDPVSAAQEMAKVIK